MRAVVLGADGQPELAEIPDPSGPGLPVRILACGLCGSDVEKIGAAPPGTVLGHEVVAEDDDGRRLALVHHAGCGQCARCRAGHESTCESFREPTIVPGGFAERALANGVVELPDGVDDVLATYAEPLACVLRAAERVPAGRVLVVGCGFVGQLFVRALRLRGNEVFAVDPRAERVALADATAPDGPVDAAVLCASGGADEAADALEPGGTLLVFAPAGPLDVDAVYRKELYVIGSRSATPRHLRKAVGLLAELDLPAAEVLPLDRFAEGLERYRSGEALKVVFRP
jgi:threonine dehydrogenase-like Zn-dependent dehydrogenase